MLCVMYHYIAKEFFNNGKYDQRTLWSTPYFFEKYFQRNPYWMLLSNAVSQMIQTEIALKFKLPWKRCQYSTQGILL